MILNTTIGPYRVQKRTEYSKMQIFDKSGTNISNTEIGKEIADEYNLQSSNPYNYFEMDDDRLISIKDAGKPLKYVFLPNHIKKIESRAFYGAGLFFISFPDYLSCIENEAFKECVCLKEAVLPQSATMLDSGIFYRCVSLEKVVLPDDIDTIPKYTFCQCYSLGNVVLPDGITKICGSAFFRSGITDEFKLPEEIHEIANYAFESCKNITKINIPRDFSSCGNDIFAASGIRELIFNHNLRERSLICYGNFSHLNIEKLTIGKNVEVLDAGFLYHFKDSLKEIDYLGTKEDFKKFSQKNAELVKMFKSTKAKIRFNSIDDKIKNNTNYLTRDKINSFFDAR